MIQISNTKYINKYQIVRIIDELDSYTIEMADGHKHYVYSSNWEYYLNIRRFLEGNNE